MSRHRFPCLVLCVLSVLLLARPAAGQVLPSPSPTQVLPLASVANWSALLLQGGILYTRVAGSQDGPFFVFAAPSAGEHTEFFAYRGGADAPAAFGSLHAKLGLSGRDQATLKTFALGVPLVAGGTWDTLTFGDGYILAADPAMGDLGTRLYGVLLVLEAGNFAANLAGTAGSKDAIAVEEHICEVQAWTAFEADDKVASSADPAFAKVLAVTAASSAKFATAAKTCKGMAEVFPFTPSFPVLTPPVYPTGPVPWKATFCPTPGAIGNCMNGLGQYCTHCICVQNGDDGVSGLWSPGNCTTVTSTLAGTACAPTGGEGPCDKSAGVACKKNCTCEPNNPATPPTGTWKCGSPGLAALFLVLVGFAWRRQTAA